MQRCLYFRESADEIRNEEAAVKAMNDGGYAAGLSNGGFADVADFLNTVRFAGVAGRNIMSPRFAAYQAFLDEARASVKAITGSAEFFDSDNLGGILMPSGFSDRLWKTAIESATTPLSMVTRRYVEGNTYFWRTWDQSNITNGRRWGGLRAYRLAEGALATTTIPKVRVMESRLVKLKCAVDVSEELVEDGAGLLDQELDDAAAGELAFTLSNEILNGKGGPECIGIVGAPCTISVAKETTQPAATILPINISKMFARLPGSLRAGAAWFLNEDCDPVLMFASANSGNAIRAEGFSFQAPGTVAGSPYAHLCGLPCIPTPQCAALGTVGDVVLAAMSEYGVTTKVTPITKQVSIHVRFDTGNTAFSYALRSHGQPLWDAPRTSLNGTTKSPFITLDTRS